MNEVIEHRAAKELVSNIYVLGKVRTPNMAIRTGSDTAVFQRYRRMASRALFLELPALKWRVSRHSNAIRQSQSVILEGG